MNFIFLVLATITTVFLASEVTSEAAASGLIITIAWILPFAFALWSLSEAWKLFIEGSPF